MLPSASAPAAWRKARGTRVSSSPGLQDLEARARSSCPLSSSRHRAADGARGARRPAHGIPSLLLERAPRRQQLACARHCRCLSCFRSRRPLRVCQWAWHATPQRVSACARTSSAECSHAKRQMGGTRAHPEVARRRCDVDSSGYLALRVASRHFNKTLLAPELLCATLKNRRLARSLALQKQCFAGAAVERGECVACAAKEALLRRQRRMLVSLGEHEDPRVRRAAMKELEAELAAGAAPASADGDGWLGRLVLWARQSVCGRRARARDVAP